MTNEELVKAFLSGKYRGDEESCGFSIKPLLKYKSCVSDFSLYSKISQFPTATKVSENYFIVSTSSVGANHGQWKKHVELVAAVAERLSIGIVFSPGADKARFQKYMEGRINGNLISLAQKLENISRGFKFESGFTLEYKRLIENIRTLLNEEIQLGLPKNQVALLDTDEVQSLWRWLIKESPDKKDRELLREMYMLSRLLGSPRREEEDRKGDLVILSNPWNKIG